MTTPYIDPNLIFAENAPTQDKPAAFENYNKGWDESRKNDGRPLIKQMNYLQQQSDLKNRYIHENGAALPYKESITYEENAVVVKDGVLQQWKDGEWVQAANKGYSLDYFADGKSYPLNARIMLENGDIVKSTTTNNTVNPNTDMTGWVDVSSAQNIKNSLGGSVQDFIDDQIQTNTLLSNISVTPEMFGAVGDGISDDTAAVKSWWESSFIYKQARGKYKVNLGVAGSTCSTDRSLYVDMVGAEFLPTTQAAYLLQVNCTADGGTIEIKGGKNTCNGLIARPLRIYGTGRCKAVSVYFNSATNVKENGQGYTTAALYIDVKSDCFDIHHNNYKDVSRITDNAGTVSCIGIFLSDVDATCLIYGNEISLIRAVNNADADGISIFSSNRLVSPSQVQRLNVRVFNNRMIDCQGRFVKLQAPAQVYSNDFRSETLPLIPTFRAVDAQFGGVSCFDNEWRLSTGLKLANDDVTFYYYQATGDTGSEENTGYCRDNKLYLADGIRYLAFVNVTGGKHVVVVKDNIVKDEDGLTKVSRLARLNIPNATYISSLSLTVCGNEYLAGLSDLIVLTGDGFGSPALNSKLTLSLFDNRAKKILSGARVVRTTSEAGNPYLGDVLIRNNGTQDTSYNTIIARGMDVTTLRAGNSFYYGNDGTPTGGLVNAPTGYSRSVFVDVRATIELTMFSGVSKAVKGNSATWYEYIGTVIT